MSRLHRLYRSATISAIVAIVAVFFTIPAVREALGGNPVMLVTLLVVGLGGLAAFIGFACVADRVAERDRPEALI
ncbi:hypothetical protein [Microbacterium sp. 77mftsu3.1]|uniref:hypothetical protein n=1 Tax=Microbacterium sp. 77mftsu3.1 TaxID=1761802 RepID=UPI0003770E4D|nr:hypothetical protein [Microbacterium sp. 77mftsu3.1]SDH41537.1 hypothetical protein SAMN04488590_3283 [Microbacterium sp. 77mftsu3.1]